MTQASKQVEEQTKNTPLFEAIAIQCAKEIDKQVLGGDPDNKPGEHYYDNLVMQRIISEHLYVLEQEHQMQGATHQTELLAKVREMVEQKIDKSPSCNGIGKGCGCPGCTFQSGFNQSLYDIIDQLTTLETTNPTKE